MVAKYVRGDFMSAEDALRVVRALEGLVTVRPVEHAEVLAAADAYVLSGYDAEYAALAERLGVPLVTSDKGVLRSVGCAFSPGAFADGAPR